MIFPVISPQLASMQTVKHALLERGFSCESIRKFQNYKIQRTNRYFGFHYFSATRFAFSIGL